jgi:flagellar protein FlbD
MIALTRLSGEPFVLNAELIKYVEALPDTFITLTTGDRIVVTEPPDEVVHRTMEYHQHKQLVPAVASSR